MTYKQQKQKLLPLNLMLLNICLLTNRLKSTWRSGGAHLCKQNIQQVCQLSRLAYIPTCRSPITNHREIQIVYNTGHHRPGGGQFLTPHTVRGCPAKFVAPG